MDSETRLRASINGLAMKKVTRFFNATTEAIIGEMLQNARRAGATKVQITTEAEAVTIRDDGVGIAEPGQLLEFGSSGWSDQRTRAEDPAGMGFFSLARRNAEVESWPRNGAGGWRISLEPKHFTGEAEASVTRCGAANRPLPSGTRVTFEQKGNLCGLRRNEIRKLCRYYPIPVVMDDERLPREHFLKGAVYKETTDGVEIGVFRSTVAYGVHLTVVNFHGHVIGNQQPVVIEPLRGYGRATPEYWFTRVHVEHAPQLELVLPARNALLEALDPAPGAAFRDRARYLDALRPVRGALRGHRRQSRFGAVEAAGTDGGDRAVRVHRGREAGHRDRAPVAGCNSRSTD